MTNKINFRQFYNIKSDLKDLSYPPENDLKINEIAILYSNMSDILRLITETYSIQVCTNMLICICIYSN